MRHGICTRGLVLYTMDVGHLYLEHPWNHEKKNVMFEDQFRNFSNFWLFPLLVGCLAELTYESYDGP